MRCSNGRWESSCSYDFFAGLVARISEVMLSYFEGRFRFRNALDEGLGMPDLDGAHLRLVNLSAYATKRSPVLL